jgi:hypothetical protein
MSGFKPGDVVVCVDDSAPNHPHRVYLRKMRPLRRGDIYRVTSVFPAPNGDASILVNRDSPSVRDDGLAGWQPARFRHLPKADPAFTEAMRALRPEKEGVA